MNTASTIPIESLSIADKIMLTEYLWDNLSQRPSNVVSPDWHGKILDDRLAALREGKTAFIAWDDAKKRLQESLQ